MADRYFIDASLSPGLVELDGAEAHHLAAVCRLRLGDAVCLFNGDGREYPARVVEVGKRRVTLEVTAIEAPQRELGFRLEVAAPLPKGDRAQFLLEKLTELGVTSFTPLHTARSVVHPREAKLDKLQRHVIEASKQCGRNVLLQVQPLTEWKTFCASSTLPASRLLAHPSAEDGLRNANRSDVVFAVGPEGGFTEEEVALALANGWQTVSLGPRILRIETAALALAASFGTQYARGN
jgi:16S rRNA (uracil1498-N3)-methyltransferase